tara:strand:- start:174 stop:854 length:681 start_codon:yes stop_codon:yes gene_type:complete
MSLSVNGLCKRFSSNAPVLNTVGFDIADGELVTITGPSGSGKSTLLHCIAGIVNPDSGRIWVDGNPVQDRKPHLRSIGIVMQDQPLYEHLSVEENVGFPLRARGESKLEIAQRVSEMLGSLQLSNIANRRASQLSGGERRRVSIGRATIVKPRTLLLDEPLVSLDQELKELIATLIRQVHNEIGATTLFVTHDQNEAKEFGDRVVTMEDLNSNTPKKSPLNPKIQG